MILSFGDDASYVKYNLLLYAAAKHLYACISILNVKHDLLAKISTVKETQTRMSASLITESRRIAKKSGLSGKGAARCVN